MKAIAYAKINNEKVMIGVFDSIETVYEDVESRLSEIGHPEWTEEYPVYLKGNNEPYRLIWAEKQTSQNIPEKFKEEVDY